MKLTEIIGTIKKERRALNNFEIPDEVIDQIIALRFSEKFENFTLADIVRYLINEGLKAAEEEAKANETDTRSA